MAIKIIKKNTVMQTKKEPFFISTDLAKGPDLGTVSQVTIDEHGNMTVKYTLDMEKASHIPISIKFYEFPKEGKPVGKVKFLDPGEDGTCWMPNPKTPEEAKAQQKVGKTLAQVTDDIKIAAEKAKAKAKYAETHLKQAAPFEDQEGEFPHITLMAIQGFAHTARKVLTDDFDVYFQEHKKVVCIDKFDTIKGMERVLTLTFEMVSDDPKECLEVVGLLL